MAACSFPECGRTVLAAKGLCRAHYMQQYRGQDLTRVRSAVEVCTVPGCSRKHAARGLCIGHYQQAKRGAEPGRLRHNRALRDEGKRLSDFVKESVALRPRDACWVDWPGFSDPNGRPVTPVEIDGVTKSVKAYRLAFFLVHNEWPNFACHRCPTHPFGEDHRCWNPDHIYSGDAATNAADRDRHRDARRAARAAK